MEAFLLLFLKVFIVFNVIMGLASFCTWVERKGSALIQDRVGANRAGRYFDFNVNIVRSWPFGFRPLGPQFTYIVLLPVVKIIQFLGLLGVINTLLNDAVKALFKEDFVPEGVSNFLHCLAPFMAVAPVFIAFALVPIAPDMHFGETVFRMQVASLNVGILFILAMGSLAVYGVAMAGWTGNNKYSLLGGLRAAAQMISYELAMGITMVTAIVMYGTADLYAMIDAQKGLWGVITQPISFIILFIVGMAETKRGPFDLPESESELIAGYFTEYSGMKFLIFWLGEFAEIALFALILSVIFFGGWHPLPFISLDKFLGFIGLTSEGTPPSILTSILAALIGHMVLMGKVVFFCVLQIVIRWTLPRFRYDQLMNLGWKLLLPLSLVNLMVMSFVKLRGWL